MRDLRHDRSPSSGARPLFTRALLHAQQTRAVDEAARRPLCGAQGYDRAAIMRLALALARRERSGHLAVPWRSLISSALKMGQSLAGQ